MKPKHLIIVAIFLLFFTQNTEAQEIKRDLNKNVIFIVEAKVKPGQFSNFVKVAQGMSDQVKQKETGALNYEWTISGDSTMCYILERYASSDAAMTHVKIFNEEFAKKFGEVLEVTGISLYGNASKELREALGGVPSRVLVAGFAR